MRRQHLISRTVVPVALAFAAVTGLPAVTGLHAQLAAGNPPSGNRTQPASSPTAGVAARGDTPAASEAPVTFTADQVEYDRDRSLVIARGGVEAWQNDHVLRADEIVFNRDTGVAAAHGNVVLLDPDGQTMFADYAELTRDMQSGIFKNVGALLKENGRMIANGGQRTGGEINELSRVVYSSCDLCANDPTKAPLWQLKAVSAVQDHEHLVIEYHDAELEMFGLPVAYFPFLAHPDPSVPRQSGLLLPFAGNSSQLGAFYAQPYYWVIDGQSDILFTPVITTRAGPQLDTEYRRRFNNGTLVINGSTGYVDKSIQGTISTRGQFNYDDTWRWGFDINRVSSIQYVQDFHADMGLQGNLNLLPSTVYLEGFGQGAYTRLDVKSYQGLNGTVTDSRLPTVLPRYVYSYFGQPDPLGGRLSLNAGAFNVMRTDGTNTRRANITADWERPFIGQLGELWKVTIHGDAAAYDFTHLNEQPNFGDPAARTAVQALPQVALDWRWPFSRDGGAWGTQLLEPMAEVIVAPRTGDSQLFRIPNEDSLDFEFSDANLFGFNRFPGIDRLEGGTRANLALHGAWYLGGTSFDGMIGQSYRTFKDNLFPEASGLHDQVSDIVARGTFAPTNWFDLTYRTRLDQKTLATRWVDTVASFGPPKLKLSGGYTYTNYDPFAFYDQPTPPPASSGFFTPRREVSMALSTSWDKYRFNGFARRDLTSSRMVGYGADAIYEDECFILDFRFYRRFTSLLNDNGATTLLIQFTFKTIGQFGYRAL